MASPQLENGYVRLAHELIRALVSCKYAPGIVLRVWLLVAAETYGRNYGKNLTLLRDRQVHQPGSQDHPQDSLRHGSWGIHLHHREVSR